MEVQTEVATRRLSSTLCVMKNSVRAAAEDGEELVQAKSKWSAYGNPFVPWSTVALEAGCTSEKTRAEDLRTIGALKSGL